MGDFSNVHASQKGMVISADEVQDTVLSRWESLCKDNPDTPLVEKSIAKNKDIMFFPVDVRDFQSWEGDHLQYYLQMFGPLLNGEKACVMIKYNPFVDIKMPAKKDHTKFANSIEATLQSKEWEIRTEFVKKMEYMIYRRHRTTFLRVHVKSSSNRAQIIKYLRNELGYETNSNDGSYAYFRALAACEKKELSHWHAITSYREYGKHPRVKTKKVFQVDINNFIKYGGDILASKSLRLDKTVLFTWDLETYKDIKREDAEPPYPEDGELSGIFQAGIAANVIHSDKPYANILITTCPQDPDPDTLVILCDDERELLTAFADVFEKIDPDLTCGYNTGGYDWPWIYTRMVEYDLVAHFANCMSSQIHKRTKKQTRSKFTHDLLKYNYQKHRVKLDADNTMMCASLNFPGYVDIDLMPWLRKENMQKCERENKYSLNFFLEMFRLPLKKDMVVNRMFDSFAQCESHLKADEEVPPELKTTMCDIGKYCSWDVLSTARLLMARNGVPDLREMSNMSYTSFNDAVWFANGMKVRNLIIADGTESGYSFNTYSEYKQQSKYGGAVVFDPIKGVATAKATIRERVATNSDWVHVTPTDVEAMENYISSGMDPQLKDQIREQVRTNIDEFTQDTQHHPVFALDYSSLYPSIIIAYNIDPTTTILDKRLAKKMIAAGKDLYYSKINYDGAVREAWFIRHDGTEESMAVGPKILLRLFRERSTLKKKLKPIQSAIELLEAGKIEQCRKDHPEYAEMEMDELVYTMNYIDSKQKARKVFMNTFYGVMGEPANPFFCLETAATVTNTGQQLIKFARDVAVDEDGCKQYYGDSVTDDTPLVVRNRNTGVVMIKTIDDLVADDEWKSYDQFKPGEPGMIEKQQAKCTLQIWTDGDWHDINRVIRHKTNKQMYRVSTHIGVIDVTADHSLMSPDREKIKPTDLEIGTELLHSFPGEFPTIDEITDDVQTHSTKVNILGAVTKEEAYVWGFFMSNGSCSDYECKSSQRGLWVLNSQNLTHINQVMEYLTICEPSIKFKLFDTKDSSGVYKLVAQSHVKLIVEKYRKLFYDKRKCKLVPMQILNEPIEIRQAFYNGYRIQNTVDNQKDMSEFYCNGKITAQCVYYLLQSLGYKYISVRMHDDKSDTYSLCVSTYPLCKNPIAVKKIKELPEVTHDTTVYDIETSKGSFLGGVGSLNCSNTDSIYISCTHDLFLELDRLYYSNQITKLEYFTKSVELTMVNAARINGHINARIAELVGNSFLKMAFEEVLWPAVFLRKKVYFGCAHEKVVNFVMHTVKDAFMKGLSIVKRDTTPMQVKLTSELVLETLSLENTMSMKQLVCKKIKEAYDRKWEISDFAKSATYKPPKPGKPGNRAVLKFIDCMRNAGKPVPRPSDRVKYVIAKTYPWEYNFRGNQRVLQAGDRMRYIDDIKDPDEIDMSYYMTKNVSGQFAQFLSYCPEFHVDPKDSTKEAGRQADTAITSKAKAWINNINNEYSPAHINKGTTYKKTFKRVIDTHFKNAKGKMSNLAHKLYQSKLGDDTSDLYHRVIDEIKTNSEKSAALGVDKYVAKMIRGKSPTYLYRLKILYSSGNHSIHKINEQHLNTMIDEESSKFHGNIHKFETMFKDRNRAFNEVVCSGLDAIGMLTMQPTTIDNDLPNPITDIRCVDAAEQAEGIDIQVELFDEFAMHYTRLQSMYTMLFNNDAMVKEINYRITKVSNSDAIPATVNVQDEQVAIVDYFSSMKTAMCDL